jgi:hypothetical protein
MQQLHLLHHLQLFYELERELFRVHQLFLRYFLGEELLEEYFLFLLILLVLHLHLNMVKQLHRLNHLVHLD